MRAVFREPAQEAHFDRCGRVEVPGLAAEDVRELVCRGREIVARFFDGFSAPCCTSPESKAATLELVTSVHAPPLRASLDDCRPLVDADESSGCPPALVQRTLQALRMDPASISASTRTPAPTSTLIRTPVRSPARTPTSPSTATRTSTASRIPASARPASDADSGGIREWFNRVPTPGR